MAAVSRRRRHLILAPLVAIVVLSLDQAAKAWARASLRPGRITPAIDGWLRFRLETNSGATLGLFSGHNELIALLSAVVIIAVAMILLRGQAGGLAGALALGAIGGGAVSNLVDRVRLGSVTDFVEVRFWPTDFNLADAAIRIGVVVFVVALLWDLARARRSAAR